MNATTTDRQQAQRFDAPVLSETDSLRVIARHDATAARRRYDAGFTQGHQDGYASGAADVEAAIADHRHNAQRLASLCAALDGAITDRRTVDARLLADFEHSVIETSLRIAEAIVGREITDHGAVVESITQCLALRPHDERVVVRLHPDDIACAAEAADAGLIRGGDEIELAADPSVARGGCVVDSGSLRIDGQLDAAVERIVDALRRS